jgi:multidrug efflux pump subunit AcrA (membrane-fusion protein)
MSSQISKYSSIKNFKSVSMVRISNPVLVLSRVLFWFLMISILSCVFVPWRQTSKGTGRVIAFDPNQRVQMITAPVSGVVEQWLINEGQSVKKGDPLLRIVDNDPNYLERLKLERDAAIKKYEASRSSSEAALSNYQRQLSLEKEGLSSRKDVEMSKITYQKLLAEEAESASMLAQKEVKYSRWQTQLVVAPADGTLLRIMTTSGVVNVSQGQDLAYFVPDTEEPAAEIFVDANDLPLVSIGREVRLQFEGWPSIQFSGFPSVAIGSFGGVVKAIDPSVSETGLFRVLVVKDPKDKQPWPSQIYLRQGTRVIGLILLDTVRLGYELWRQVNGFPKSMDVSKQDGFYYGNQNKKSKPEKLSEDEKTQ